MKKTIKDIVFQNKIVFVRVDFNVPLRDSIVADDTRIVEALPTLKYLVDQGAKVVVLSHLGKVSHKEEQQCQSDKIKNDMRYVAPIFEQLIGKKIIFWPATRGYDFASLQPGDVLLLQNTRYEKGEEKNDDQLSTYWASIADVYVMDAFGTAHREHASTYGLPKKMAELGKETAIGFLVEKEVKALEKCITHVERPYIAVLGGVKVSDKIKVIEVLLEKVDKILIGGAMGHTFLSAQGYDVGTSRVEKDQFDFVRKCLNKAKGKIILPIDHIIANDFAIPTQIRTTEGLFIEPGFMALDIGPRTRQLFADELKGAKTIFWNGPMGVFENPKFAEGTKSLCASITAITDAFSVIGGGDSAAASTQFGYSKQFSHVSTGGGASLEMIENDGHLPGIDIIQNRGE